MPPADQNELALLCPCPFFLKKNSCRFSPHNGPQVQRNQRTSTSGSHQITEAVIIATVFHSRMFGP